MSQLVTGEAVVLQVRIARMPTRALACAIDTLAQLVVLTVLLLLLAPLLFTDISEALAMALVFIALLLVLVGYRLVMETLTRGRTLGKLVLGLRVVRDDGSSIRFRHALVRSLLWIFVDFAPWFAASPGIVASLMHKQGKRIGDMVAGTVVIRERHHPMASPALFVPGHLVQWAQSLELSRLPTDLANTAREYLARYTELEPAARHALGETIAYQVSQVTAPVPPVHLIAPAYLSAILAERRRRELDRLSTPRPSTGPFPSRPQPALVPHHGPPQLVPGQPVPGQPVPGQPVPAPGGPLGPYQPVAAGPFPAPIRPSENRRPAAVNAHGWAAPGSEEPIRG